MDRKITTKLWGTDDATGPEVRGETKIDGTDEGTTKSRRGTTEEIVKTRTDRTIEEGTTIGAPEKTRTETCGITTPTTNPLRTDFRLADGTIEEETTIPALVKTRTEAFGMQTTTNLLRTDFRLADGILVETSLLE